MINGELIIIALNPVLFRSLKFIIVIRKSQLAEYNYIKRIFVIQFRGRIMFQRISLFPRGTFSMVSLL